MTIVKYRSVVANGTKVFYREAGSPGAPKLLLLHGFPSSSHMFRDLIPLGWAPHAVHHVAGAFRYTAYDFLKRWAMKYIAYRKGAPTDTSRDYELTDWDDLTSFADSFVKSRADPRQFSS